MKSRKKSERYRDVRAVKPRRTCSVTAARIAVESHGGVTLLYMTFIPNIPLFILIFSHQIHVNQKSDLA